MNKIGNLKIDTMTVKSILGGYFTLLLATLITLIFAAAQLHSLNEKMLTKDSAVVLDIAENLEELAEDVNDLGANGEIDKCLSVMEEKIGISRE